MFSKKGQDSFSVFLRGGGGRLKKKMNIYKQILLNDNTVGLFTRSCDFLMPVVYDCEAFSIKIVHAVVRQRIVLPVDHDVISQPLPTGTQLLGAAVQTRVELVATLLFQQAEGRVVITVGSEVAGI